MQDLLLVIGPKPDEGGVELGGGGGKLAQPLHQHDQQAQHKPWAGHRKRKMVVSKNDWVSTRAPGQRQGTRQLSNPRRGCPLLSSGTSCRGNEREMMLCSSHGLNIKTCGFGRCSTRREQGRCRRQGQYWKKVFFFLHKITEGEEEGICKERLHDCEGSDGPLEHDVVESADAPLQEEPLVFLAWVE